ncbi:MAG TPA: glycosyltransferase, partial [Ktedonobacterales bacterium]
DAYRAQVQFATDTKAWRASVAYWRAREHGLPGALALGGQLATYLARVGYHLGVPYPVRRDLWYRRHTGKSYQSYYRALGATEAASAALQAASEPANVRKAVGPDVLFFPAQTWEASTAAQRRLAQRFARAGHRCCWLSPQLAMAPVGETGSAVARRLKDAMGDDEASAGAGGIEGVTLPGDGNNIAVKPVFRRSAQRHALAALTRYCFARDLREVICVVQHPGWGPLVEALRHRYGWKVIYDLVDEQEPSDARVDARLHAMLANADLTIISAPAQREWLRGQGVAAAALIAEGDALGALTECVRQLYGRATIIIVTYRNLARTRLALSSVLEKTRYPNYEVVLVDNGGEPAIQHYAREMSERFPGVVRCIFNGENLGFAGGNNVGLRAAPDSDYIVLLNDDVVVTAGWLGGLLRYLDNPQVGLVGPVTNSCGNEACIAVDYSDIAQVDDFARRYTLAHDGASFDIAVLAMYCLAMRQQTAAALGELDERFRMGMFEDDDYAVRAQHAGYRVVCAEDVYVHHFGRSSFGKMTEEAHARLFDANRALFEQKWGVNWRPHKYREG